MSVSSLSLARPEPTSTLARRTVMISAWAVPVLVVGQFAMLAIVPVALVLVGAVADARLRSFRGWAAGLAVAYAVPLVLRALGPDPGLSLSKSMSPTLTALLVAASVVVAVAVTVLARRRPR